MAFGGGELEIVVNGTFGGATVTLEANYPAVGAWVPIWQGTWTDSQVKILRLIRACSIRLTISSAGGSTSISAWI